MPDELLDEVDGVGMRRPPRGGPCRSAAATWRANGRSSKPSRSSKPIVNVSTGRPVVRAITATIALESIPPLRKAPSGTSETSRRSTAASSACATALAAPSPRRSSALDAVVTGQRRRPVLVQPRLAAALQHEHVPGRDAANAGEERVRRRHVAERQVGRDRARIELARDRRMREHGLDLAGEHEHPVRSVPVVQRLLAQAIASEHEPLAARVVDREGEHAVQPPRERDRVELLGEMGDDLGVALRAQLVAGAQQLLAQRGGSCRSRR